MMPVRGAIARIGRSLREGKTMSFEKLKELFILNFVEKQRWKYLVEGLGNTMLITLFAVLLGVAIGIVVASVRSTFDKEQETLKRRGGFGYFILRFFNGICKVYRPVIRGTPVVGQLMIL